MKHLDRAATEQLLPYPPLRDAIAAALRARQAGRVEAPERTATPLPHGGWLLLMGATSPTTAIAKVVTVHPHNPTQRVHSDVILIDATDGRRLAMLDGEAVTERRTAALSLLAAERLAPAPTADLLLIGAGAQARAHLEAFRIGLGTARVWVSSRSASRRDALVHHARSLGMTAAALDDPHQALTQPLLVVTATSSAEPVLHRPPPPGSFVAAVGAFRATMAELAPAVLADAMWVVDTREGAEREGGDLLRAQVDWTRVHALQDRLDHPRPTQTVIFKSVGHAIFDLAAGLLVRAQILPE
jgi:1-piperideine-2-carboxylate/1-pyrroline-2-carboxylate reductase [NAD(P)H]